MIDWFFSLDRLKAKGEDGSIPDTVVDYLFPQEHVHAARLHICTPKHMAPSEHPNIRGGIQLNLYYQIKVVPNTYNLRDRRFSRRFQKLFLKLKEILALSLGAEAASLLAKYREKKLNDQDLKDSLTKAMLEQLESISKQVMQKLNPHIKQIVTVQNCLKNQFQAGWIQFLEQLGAEALRLISQKYKSIEIAKIDDEIKGRQKMFKRKTTPKRTVVVQHQRLFKKKSGGDYSQEIIEFLAKMHEQDPSDSKLRTPHQKLQQFHYNLLWIVRQPRLAKIIGALDQSYEPTTWIQIEKYFAPLYKTFRYIDMEGQASYRSQQMEFDEYFKKMQKSLDKFFEKTEPVRIEEVADNYMSMLGTEIQRRFRSKFYMIKAIKCFLHRKRMNVKDRRKVEHVKKWHKHKYAVYRDADIEKIGFGQFLRLNESLVLQKWVKRPFSTRTFFKEQFPEAREAFMYDITGDDQVVLYGEYLYKQFYRNLFRVCDTFKTNQEIKNHLTQIDEMHYLLGSLLDYLFAPEEQYLQLEDAIKKFLKMTNNKEVVYPLFTDHLIEKRLGKEYEQLNENVNFSPQDNQYFTRTKIKASEFKAKPVAINSVLQHLIQTYETLFEAPQYHIKPQETKLAFRDKQILSFILNKQDSESLIKRINQKRQSQRFKQEKYNYNSQLRKIQSLFILHPNSSKNASMHLQLALSYVMIKHASNLINFLFEAEQGERQQISQAERAERAESKVHDFYLEESKRTEKRDYSIVNLYLNTVVQKYNINCDSAELQKILKLVYALHYNETGTKYIEEYQFELMKVTNNLNNDGKNVRINYSLLGKYQVQLNLFLNRIEEGEQQSPFFYNLLQRMANRQDTLLFDCINRLSVLTPQDMVANDNMIRYQMLYNTKLFHNLKEIHNQELKYNGVQQNFSFCENCKCYKLKFQQTFVQNIFSKSMCQQCILEKFRKVHSLESQILLLKNLNCRRLLSGIQQFIAFERIRTLKEIQETNPQKGPYVMISLNESCNDIQTSFLFYSHVLLRWKKVVLRASTTVNEQQRKAQYKKNVQLQPLSVQKIESGIFLSEKRQLGFTFRISVTELNRYFKQQISLYKLETLTFNKQFMDVVVNNLSQKLQKLYEDQTNQEKSQQWKSEFDLSKDTTKVKTIKFLNTIYQIIKLSINMKELYSTYDLIVNYGRNILKSKSVVTLATSRSEREINRKEMNRFLVGRRGNQQLSYQMQKMTVPLLNVKRMSGLREVSEKIIEVLNPEKKLPEAAFNQLAPKKEPLLKMVTYFKNLEYLDLSGCGINYVDNPFYTSFLNLKELNLSHNNLIEFNLLKLVYCQHLHTVILDHNRLKDLVTNEFKDKQKSVNVRRISLAHQEKDPSNLDNQFVMLVIGIGKSKRNRREPVASFKELKDYNDFSYDDKNFKSAHRDEDNFCQPEFMVYRECGFVQENYESNTYYGAGYFYKSFIEYSHYRFYLCKLQELDLRQNVNIYGISFNDMPLLLSLKVSKCQRLKKIVLKRLSNLQHLEIAVKGQQKIFASLIFFHLQSLQKLDLSNVVGFQLQVLTDRIRKEMGDEKEKKDRQAKNKQKDRQAKNKQKDNQVKDKSSMPYMPLLPFFIEESFNGRIQVNFTLLTKKRLYKSYENAKKPQDVPDTEYNNQFLSKIKPFKDKKDFQLEIPQFVFTEQVPNHQSNGLQQSIQQPNTNFTKYVEQLQSFLKKTQKIRAVKLIIDRLILNLLQPKIVQGDDRIIPLELFIKYKILKNVSYLKLSWNGGQHLKFHLNGWQGKTLILESPGFDQISIKGMNNLQTFTVTTETGKIRKLSVVDCKIIQAIPCYTEADELELINLPALKQKFIIKSKSTLVLQKLPTIRSLQFDENFQFKPQDNKIKLNFQDFPYLIELCIFRHHYPFIDFSKIRRNVRVQIKQIIKQDQKQQVFNMDQRKNEREENEKKRSYSFRKSKTAFWKDEELTPLPIHELLLQNIQLQKDHYEYLQNVTKLCLYGGQAVEVGQLLNLERLFIQKERIGCPQKPKGDSQQGRNGKQEQSVDMNSQVIVLSQDYYNHILKEQKKQYFTEAKKNKDLFSSVEDYEVQRYNEIFKLHPKVIQNFKSRVNLVQSQRVLERIDPLEPNVEQPERKPIIRNRQKIQDGSSHSDSSARPQIYFKDEQKGASGLGQMADEHLQHISIASTKKLAEVSILNRRNLSFVSLESLQFLTTITIKQVKFSSFNLYNCPNVQKMHFSDVISQEQLCFSKYYSLTELELVNVKCDQGLEISKCPLLIKLNIQKLWCYKTGSVAIWGLSILRILKIKKCHAAQISIEGLPKLRELICLQFITSSLSILEMKNLQSIKITYQEQFNKLKLKSMPELASIRYDRVPNQANRYEVKTLLIIKKCGENFPDYDGYKGFKQQFQNIAPNYEIRFDGEEQEQDLFREQQPSNQEIEDLIRQLDDLRIIDDLNRHNGERRQAQEEIAERQQEEDDD